MLLLVNELAGLAEMSVPSKLTSYFDAGRPVLAATSEGSTTAHELRDSGAGTRVDAQDPEALLAAALELGADPGRRRELGAAGRRYRVDVLSEEAAVDRFEEWLARHGGREGAPKGLRGAAAAATT